MKVKKIFRTLRGQIGAPSLYALPSTVPVPIQNCFLQPCTVSAPPSTFLNTPLRRVKQTLTAIQFNFVRCPSRQMKSVDEDAPCDANGIGQVYKN